MKLLEAEIKTMLLNYLRAKDVLIESSTIINEFTIDWYSRRVDIALFQQNMSIAFEIKSEADSLVRLEGQTKKYLEYFDKVIVVAAEKHISSIQSMVPAHVAIWQVSDAIVKVVQRGRKKQIKSAKKLMDLMTVDDLNRICNQPVKGAEGRKRHALECALENFHVNRLRSGLFEGISKRYKRPNKQFFFATKNRAIQLDDLDLLSNYKSLRHSHKSKELKKVELEKKLKNACSDTSLLEARNDSSTPMFGEVPHEIKEMLYA